MVRERRTGRGPGLAMMLTVCDKDCDLAARPKANFTIATVLSSGLTNGAAWLRCVTPAAGAQVRLVVSTCLLALLVIVWHHGAGFRLWRGSIITICVIPTFFGYQSLRKCRDYYVSLFVVNPFLLVIYKFPPYRHGEAVACARACVLLSVRVVFSVFRSSCTRLLICIMSLSMVVNWAQRQLVSMKAPVFFWQN